MDKKKIGALLAAKRTALGLTSQEMGMEIGCNRTTIDRMERGDTCIKRSKLTRIAQAYGVPATELANMCGYDMDGVPGYEADIEIAVTADDLKFLLTVAEGLKAPLNISLIRELLKRRQQPSTQPQA
ncbi:MAG TPA: helix-turn-helix domain-containing protein [Candidatus Paceibacterota bacterium]|nr:helix-turn-helix domain-containing protein [Candidatus Paceibacterota bacterium]